jgi:hypothetical protein
MTSTLHANHQRIRTTPATKRRDQNVRSIVAALRNASMLKDDLRDMLGISQSGINKYVQLLRTAGVIELERYVGATRTSQGIPVLRIARDSAVVDAYLLALEEAPAFPRTARPVDHARHIHRIEDDGHFPDRSPTVGIPAPDPVLAAFFGLGTVAEHPTR